MYIWDNGQTILNSRPITVNKNWVEIGYRSNERWAVPLKHSTCFLTILAWYVTDRFRVWNRETYTWVYTKKVFMEQKKLKGENSSYQTNLALIFISIPNKEEDKNYWKIWKVKQFCKLYMFFKVSWRPSSVCLCNKSFVLILLCLF